MLKKHLFALITVACLTMLTSCAHETNAASEQTAVPVQVRTPAVVERAESVSASGSIEGSETADVAFQVGGRVIRVLVEEGRHVSQGQLLAELEPTDYRNAFDAATAQKQAARHAGKLGHQQPSTVRRTPLRAAWLQRRHFMRCDPELAQGPFVERDVLDLRVRVIERDHARVQTLTHDQHPAWRLHDVGAAVVHLWTIWRLLRDATRHAGEVLGGELSVGG